MLVDSSRQRNLFPDVRTSWLGKLNLCQIRLDRDDSATARSRANIDKQKLAFGKFLNLEGVRTGKAKARLYVPLSVSYPRSLHQAGVVAGRD